MKTVRYSDLGRCELGRCAHAITIDHPTARNGSWVMTTPVTRIIKGPRGPRFQTANTLYIPAIYDMDPLPNVGHIQFEQLAECRA